MRAITAEANVGAFSDYIALTKPRITTLVLATTLVGFYLASQANLDLFLLVHTLLGTALVAAGASALNMALEWEPDSRMRRTENRPIPAGRVSLLQGFAFGSGISLFGLVYLWMLVNWLTSLLALITVSLYLFAYTPLKRKTWWCTLVGAVPGAIPPLMGWAAVRESLSVPALWLFAVLFFWQLPHFFAIAWIYREDYARGGFPMLPVVDPEGIRTGRHIVLGTLALLMVSLIPVRVGVFHQAYFWGACFLGSLFLVAAVRLVRERSNASARRLLLASVFYLPLLLILIMIGKV